MTLYTLHQGQDPREAPTLIAHRFSWAAFLFGPLWLASRRLWLVAALLAAFDAAVLLSWKHGFLTAGPASLALVVAAFLIGLEAAEMLRRLQMDDGSELVGVANGADEVEALARLSTGSRP